MVLLEVVLMSGRKAVIDAAAPMTARELRVAAQRHLQVRLASLVQGGRVLPDDQLLGRTEGETVQAVVRGPCVASGCYSRAFARVDAAGQLRAWGSAAYGGRLELEIDEVEQVQHAAAFFEAGAFAALRSDGSAAH